MGSKGIFHSSLTFIFIGILELGFISFPAEAAIKKYQFDVSASVSLAIIASKLTGFIG